MPITHGYIDLARIKARLGITDTDDDAALIDVVNSVCRWVDVHCRRRFYVSDNDETRYFTPITPAYCRIDDLASVTSIATDSGDRSFGTLWSAGDYHLVAQSTEMPGLPVIGLRIADNGRYRFEPRYYNSVRVVGKFGFAANSEALEIVREAVTIQVARIFKRPDAPFGVAGAGPMGQVMTINEIDPDLKAMLAPPLRKLGAL